MLGWRESEDRLCQEEADKMKDFIRVEGIGRHVKVKGMTDLVRIKGMR